MNNPLENKMNTPNQDTNTLEKPISSKDELEFALETLSPEDKKEVLEEMGKLVWEEIVNTCLNSMSQEKIEEFSVIATKEPQGEDDRFNIQIEIFQFFEKNVPDFRSIVDHETEQARKDFILILKNKQVDKIENTQTDIIGKI